MLGQPDIDTLENMIDRHSVEQVLDALATICTEKADHLRSNWQDEFGGKMWDKIARQVRSLAAKIDD